MTFTTLNDDLLKEFREERIMINDQIEFLDPLAISLRKPAAQRLLSNSTWLLTEYMCYLISIGGLACVACMHLIYPFSLLHDLFYSPQSRDNIGVPNLIYLMTAVYGIAVLAAIFMFIIGRMAREMRLKNEILNVAGKEIKGI